MFTEIQLELNTYNKQKFAGFYAICALSIQNTEVHLEYLSIR